MNCSHCGSTTTKKNGHTHYGKQNYFCSVIQVFGDNMAKETASVGFGPLKMTGGIDKSFYVKKGDEIFWLKKSDFDEGYDKLFADSPEFVAKYPKKDAVWRKLNLYVYEYTKFMSKE